MEDTITQFVDTLGYIGVAFLMFLENVFPPIPSELIMPLAGFTAAREDSTLLGMIIAGSIGSVLGQYPIYWVGHKLGHERLKQFVDRYGRWLTISGREVDRAGDWFDRHGGKSVLICRLIPGVRSLISLPAGMQGMSLARFTLYSAAGIVVWSAILAVAGHFLGDRYEQVESWLQPFGAIVFGGLGLAFFVWIGYRLYQCKTDPDRSCIPSPSGADPR
ncbi:MAG: DedA family protein [Phycisphaerales bacterium]